MYHTGSGAPVENPSSSYVYSAGKANARTSARDPKPSNIPIRSTTGQSAEATALGRAAPSAVFEINQLSNGGEFRPDRFPVRQT